MAELIEGAHLEPRDLVDWLLSHGRHWVTTSEVAQLLSIPMKHVAPTLARLRRGGQLFSPTKGLYVAIPAQFRSWGAVPASHFIDAMMNHLNHDYYACLLSAAEIHGFAHQRPQVFQVMTTARLRDRSFGRVRVEFVLAARANDRAIDIVNTPTGTVRVSTREVTLLDLIAFPNRSGALHNVATVIGEMLLDGSIDFAALAKAAGTYPTSIPQRAGWLIDHIAQRMGLSVDTATLLAATSARRTPTPLDPSGGRAGMLDPRWHVIVNTELEEDS